MPVNTWVIIQARTSSRRLPGKVMEDIEGAPLISHVIKRVKESMYGGRICMATSKESGDDVLAGLGRDEGIEVFRGDIDDVLSRYYFAAKGLSAGNIIRITGDCPLIDPEIINRVADSFFEDKADYTSNVHPPTFPDGLDVEVFTSRALERAYHEADKKYQREHVTPYLWENRSVFKTTNVFNDDDMGDLRWIVDERSDLEFTREIYARLYKPGKVFHMEDILAVINKEPGLKKINENLGRNEGFIKSLEEEGVN